MTGADDGPAGRSRPSPKLRASALNHLKLAAAELPDIAEAQAQVRRRAGPGPGAEPRPPVPPERPAARQPRAAVPALGRLDDPPGRLSRGGRADRQVAAPPGRAGEPARATWRGRSTCSSGELYQARRSPEDLKKAVEEFDKALAAGQAVTPTAVIRLAQIDVQLGQYDRALARLERAAVAGQGGPDRRAARRPDARGEGQEGRGPRAARRRPAASIRRSAELAGLEAALLVKDGKPEEADAVLERVPHAPSPTTHSLVMMRAQIQAETLKDPDQARALLEGIAERSDNSAPLVQLAGLELERNRLDEAAAVIAKIRARWKEAADRRRPRRPARAQARQDGRGHRALRRRAARRTRTTRSSSTGRPSSTAGPARSPRRPARLEDIVRDKPVKEVDAGTTPADRVTNY